MPQPTAPMCILRAGWLSTGSAGSLHACHSGVLVVGDQSADSVCELRVHSPAPLHRRTLPSPCRYCHCAAPQVRIASARYPR